jgi:hypothetical protein
MANFALVDNGTTVVRYQEFGSQPSNPAGKPWFTWLPVVDTNPSVSNPETEIKEGPVVTVGPSNVTRVWTVRAKTAPELDAQKTAIVDGLQRLILEALFNHENRIRALDGQGAVTRAQFKNAIKGML